ncbi:MAG TPA: tetratricopeptide repeat protein [Planctomycetota bacterium]
MKIAPILLLVLIGSFAGSLFFNAVLGGGAGGTDASREDSGTQIAPLRTQVDALESRNQALARTVSELQGQVQFAGGAPVRSELGGMDAAVDRWMREHGAEVAAANAEAARTADAIASGKEATPRERTIAFLDRVADPALDEEGRERVWQELRDAGLMDQAIAILEERAKADATYNAILELDPGNWDARFNKAVSLSFWPPALEAVKHFETLVEQQRGMPARAGQEQSYIFLGNMYQQMGSRDKALEIWREGLLRHPDDAELRKQIELAGG